MKLRLLEAYVKEQKKWYLEKYGKLDWHWYDEGLYYTIADYVGMMGEFSEEDKEFLKRTEFEPEDFIEEEEE